MIRPTRKDIIFLFLIAILLFISGAYAYLCFDSYYNEQRSGRNVTVVSVTNGADPEYGREAYPSLPGDSLRPVTDNIWSDGSDDYYYLGNRMIQAQDFQFSYAGLENYIYIDDKCQNDAVLETFGNMMCYAPQNVLNSYIEKGGVFIFCDETALFEHYRDLYGSDESAWDSFYDGQYEIDGFICYKEDGLKIYYKNDVDSVIRSSLHELGHYIDKYDPNIEMLSSTDEFMDIYYRESCESDLSDYALSGSDEYFAECFQQMLIDPTFRARCPETCDYIEQCYRNI